jgi:hypothetical protein
MSALSKFDTTIATRLAPSVAVLEARAEARAILWHEYQLEHLPDAVDPLQAFAEQSGLVALIGQDACQQIIAAPFERLRSAEDEPLEAEPDTFVPLSEISADIMRTWELADV